MTTLDQLDLDHIRHHATADPNHAERHAHTAIATNQPTVPTAIAAELLLLLTQARAATRTCQQPVPLATGTTRPCTHPTGHTGWHTTDPTSATTEWAAIWPDPDTDPEHDEHHTEAYARKVAAQYQLAVAHRTVTRTPWTQP